MSDSKHVRRELFRGHKACPLGCVYCFADFKSYKTNSGLEDFELNDVDDFSIIYPSCDNEFALDAANRTLIQQLVSQTRKNVGVSISVKSLVGQKLISELKNTHDQLVTTGRGVLKCSVSVTTKHNVRLLEPKTASYDDRLECIRRIAAAGIPTSVNLKPMLPDISTEEYCEIIEDFRTYTDMYLLGGAYIDPTSDYGASVVERFGEFLTMRTVTWLPSRPTWPYYEDADQMKRVKAAIREVGATAFESDLEVMRAIAAKVGLNVFSA